VHAGNAGVAKWPANADCEEHASSRRWSHTIGMRSVLALRPFPSDWPYSNCLSWRSEGTTRVMEQEVYIHSICLQIEDVRMKCGMEGNNTHKISGIRLIEKNCGLKQVKMARFMNLTRLFQGGAEIFLFY
jgi:hypothetical protein